MRRYYTLHKHFNHKHAGMSVKHVLYRLWAKITKNVPPIFHSEQNRSEHFSVSVVNCHHYLIVALPFIILFWLSNFHVMRIWTQFFFLVPFSKYCQLLVTQDKKKIKMWRPFFPMNLWRKHEHEHEHMYSSLIFCYFYGFFFCTDVWVWGVFRV